MSKDEQRAKIANTPVAKASLSLAGAVLGGQCLQESVASASIAGKLVY